jgi:hypothetical protein
LVETGKPGLLKKELLITESEKEGISDKNGSV